MRIFYLLTVAVMFLLTGCGGSQPGVEPVKPVQITGEHPTVAWILACRVEGEGFGCFPGDSAFVTRTGMACEALAEMGEPGNLPDKESIVSWLKSKQQPDGGFIEAHDYYQNKLLPWGSLSALEPTYWALKTLRLLGSEPDRPKAAARFIRARQLPSGAFDSYELGWNTTRTREMAYSTFWAVAALKELGEPVPDSAQVVEWARSLQDTQSGLGGFRLGDNAFIIYTVQGTYYAVRILELLGARPRRPALVKKFLLSSYGQEADGGFECGHGDNWNNYDHYSRMVDTYGSVYALELLGMPLSDHDTSRASQPASDCADWIASVQNPDGGFARFGVTEQTPLRTPSEMRATWQAVKTLKLLGRELPCPDNLVVPANEVRPHVPGYRYPAIHNDDPAEVWAYRRIALPIYSHYLKESGSRIKALGWLSRWARAAVSPMNAAFCTGGRSLLMHGCGQCAQMSLMLQKLAASVDYPARFSFTKGCVGGDVNCEILVQEEGWGQPHWCLFIPFSNEYPDPAVPTPEGKINGWSGLDCIIDFKNRRNILNFPSRTRLGDHCFLTVRIETIDYNKASWAGEYRMDTLTTYNSEVAKILYPGASW